jgi:hypothetical protein
MGAETTPLATVTGLYRGTFNGLEPLSKETPLSLAEVRKNPIFYELELNPEGLGENLIIDVCYDNMSPMPLQNLSRGTDIPRGVRFWPHWFEIPPSLDMQDTDGHRVYPRAPGIHTVRIRTAKRRFNRMGKDRDFSPANSGYTSPVFEITLTADGDDV